MCTGHGPRGGPEGGQWGEEAARAQETALQLKLRERVESWGGPSAFLSPGGLTLTSLPGGEKKGDVF